ncbi:MAG: ATP-binding protein [Thermodesulfobacteriota bacterium]
MSEEVFLSVSSHPRNLCLIRDVIKRVTKGMGFSEEESARTALALDEACCNIIKYSYNRDFSGKIEITFRISEEALEITVRDFGKYGKDFDIDKIRCCDKGEVTPGGFGVNIMRSVMDRVEYRPCTGKGNTLTMSKRIK